MGSRRKAREAVLKVLYLIESREISVDAAFLELEAIDLEIKERAGDPEIIELKPLSLGLDKKQSEFARSLAHSIVGYRKKLNDHITPVLENWDISRISRIDRIIMWIALAEMTFMLDIPPNVSINEAIELAKKYSSEKSPSFINGVLDATARKMGIISD